MKKSFLPALLAIAFISSGAAHAVEPPPGPDAAIQTIAAQMPPAWLACRNAGDCSLLPFNCGDMMAVNGQHLSEAKGIAYQIVSDPAAMNCAESPAAPPFTDAPACVENRCEVAQIRKP
jgi:hypothetical protein